MYSAKPKSETAKDYIIFMKRPPSFLKGPGWKRSRNWGRN